MHEKPSFSLSEYDVQQCLESSPDYQIYKGRCLKTQSSVILKRTPNSPLNLSTCEHERNLLMDLPQGEFHPPLILKPDAKNLVSVFSGLDPDFQSLSSWLHSEGAKSISEILHIFYTLILKSIHLEEFGVRLHGTSIYGCLISLDEPKMRRVDYRLAHSAKCIPNWSIRSNAFQSYWASISPEQTGRLGQSLDARSELYALGMIFYQLITDRFPFDANDFLGWTHHHLATSVPPPVFFNPECPKGLSNLILKLLEKSPSDRYQSFEGVLKDLEHCMKEWRKNYQISEFPLAQQESFERIKPFNEFYGRSADVERLKDSWKRSLTGLPQWKWVLGESGSGKSSLVQQLRPVVYLDQGLWLEGKSDQATSTPYYALTQVLEYWRKHLLSLPDEKMQFLKNRIEQTMGANTQILVELCPPLESFLGKTPSLTSVSAREAKQRFLNTMQGWLEVVLEEQPLVLVIDDLQWADEETLSLLRNWFQRTQSGNLTFLGTLRNDEISETLQVFLEEVNCEQNSIVLGPLSKEETRQILLNHFTRIDQQDAFTELMLQKSQGMPLLLQKLVNHCHSEKWVWWDSQQSQWEWDVRSLETLPAQSSLSKVWQLLQQENAAFFESKNDFLQKAAFLGSPFSLERLSWVSELSEEQLQPLLNLNVQYGILSPMFSDSQEYRFAHDFIQKYFLENTSVEQQTQIHTQIAFKLLTHIDLENASDADLEQILFHGIRSHWKSWEPHHQKQLLSASIQLSLHTKDKQTYSNAWETLCLANELLGCLGVSVSEQEGFLVQKLYVECAYVCGKEAEAESYASGVLDQLSVPLQKAEIKVIQLSEQVALGNFEAAFAHGVQALAFLNYPLPGHVSMARVAWEGLMLRLRLRKYTKDDLLNQPLITERADQLTIRILLELMILSAYLKKEAFYLLLAFRMVEFSLQHGNSSESAMAYTTYGFLQGGFFGKYQERLFYGDVGFELNKRLKDGYYHARTIYTYALYIMPWKASWDQMTPLFQQTFDEAQQSGDTSFSAFSITCMYQWNPRLPLQELVQKTDQLLPFSQQALDPTAYNFIRIYQYLNVQLIGVDQLPASHELQHFSLDESIEKAKQSGFFLGVASAHINALRKNVILQKYDEAIHNIEEASPYLVLRYGSPDISLFHIYRSLTYLALWDQQDSKVQAKWWQWIQASRKKIIQWSKLNPDTFEHLGWLIRAEQYRICGKTSKAAAAYEKAILLVDQQQSLADGGLIYECAASFYEKQGHSQLMLFHLTSAYARYFEWGALKKCEQLKQHHPSLESRPADTHSTSQQLEGDLEWQSLLKAYQTLSASRQTQTQSQELLHIAIENVGAEKGVLLIKESGKLCVSSFWAQGEFTQYEKCSLDQVAWLPKKTLMYVSRTQSFWEYQGLESIQLDPYYQHHPIQTALCFPLKKQDTLIGLLYLENKHTSIDISTQQQVFLQHIANYAATLLDNTRLYQELEQQKEQLLHKNQELQQNQEFQERFLANTSHELRTPLNIVVGLLDSVQKKLDPQASSLNQEVQLAQWNSRRLSLMINELLDVLKLKHKELPLKQSKVQVSELLSLVSQSFDPVISQKGLKFVVDLESSLPPVYVDVSRFQQVLYNLLDNAIKFTDSGCITLKAFLKDEQVCIQVQDTGAGIEPQEIERILKPFEQVVSKSYATHGGTGLGLSIVEQLVQLHGGVLKVESQVGEGSCFSVLLPMCDDETELERVDPSPQMLLLSDTPQLSEVPKTPSTVEGAKKETLLIVDDEPGNLQVLQNYLQDDGYSVMSACSGEEALEVIANTDREIHLVVLDIMMPEMDGYEVCQEIRKTYSRGELPVVFLTARSEFEDGAHGFGVGGNDFISKPIEGHVLLARISTQIDLSRQWHQRALKIQNFEQQWLSDLIFIRKLSNSHYCEICRASQEDLEIIRISRMSDIQEVLQEHLIQINQSTLIHPHAVHGIRSTSGKNKSYELKVQLRHQQFEWFRIARTQLEHVKEHMSQWFEKETNEPV